MVWFSGGGDFKVSFNNYRKLYQPLQVKLQFCVWICKVFTCISIIIVENGNENDMSPSA